MPPSLPPSDSFSLAFTDTISETLTLATLAPVSTTVSLVYRGSFIHSFPTLPCPSLPFSFLPLPLSPQVCTILLDLCAVKQRMGLAEDIVCLMESHRIPKGN